jgi:hypothetical protein
MKWNPFKTNYVVLQEMMPPQERTAVEDALQEALMPVAPSRAYVTRVGQDLKAAARTRQAAKQEWLPLGVVGGGLLSLVGGLIVWLLVQRKKQGAPTSMATA